MKTLILLSLVAITLTGCAASLKFIDQQTGTAYLGKTGSTSSHTGDVTATIAGKHYTGTYAYSPDGGGYSIGSFGTGTAYGMTSGVSLSSHGQGLITMRGDNGSYVRCVFNFNAGDGSGLGHCKRNDGHMYDLVIDR